MALSSIALPLALLATGARAQDYRFPAADEHYSAFYPTAYKDDGGADWACGGIYYAGHDGSDFGVGGWAGMDAGRAIVAAAEGVVVATNDGEYDRCDSGACGESNYVILEHANGRRTWYWHLKQWTVAVSAGQWVSCGTHLGYAGSSGNSTGPHIHFEVREPGNTPSDPFDGPCSAPPTYWISQGDYGGLPGNSCPNSGPCSPVATLSCGQTIGSANNAAGATQTHSTYGCGEPTSGAEIAFSFTTPVAEPVTLGLTGLSADLDLFLLNSTACDGSGALTCSVASDASEEWITFDAAAGATYTVVVDGWSGAVSGFNLSASCTGGLGPDTGPAPDTAGEDSAEEPTGHPDPEVLPRPGEAVPLGQTGCGFAPTGGEGASGPGTPVPLEEAGCTGGAGGLLLAGAGVVGWRRRRLARRPR